MFERLAHTIAATFLLKYEVFPFQSNTFVKSKNFVEVNKISFLVYEINANFFECLLNLL
jgi:hypothetical protein